MSSKVSAGSPMRLVRRGLHIASTLLALARTPSLPLLYCAARANMPRLCAVLMLIFMDRVRFPAKSGTPPKRFLVLTKSVFIEDVRAIAAEIEGAELFLFGRTKLHFIAKAFFAKGTDDNNYHDMAGEEIIGRYRTFLAAVWKSLGKWSGISCALSGNFSYYEERELAYVLDRAGIPFVVVHKECLKTPERIKEYEDLYRKNKGPYWGTRILVYNNIENDLIVRTGVTSADKVKVVGMPRLDAVHQARLDPALPARTKGVLLISFHKDLNTLENIPGVKTPCLDTIWDSVHLAMFRLAQQRPDLPVVIKTKGDVKDRAWMDDLIHRHGLPQGLPNLTIRHGGEIRDLLITAKVVVGVHSTALLEALAANKPVIVPEYAELSNPENHGHLVDFGGTVIRVASEADLMEEMDRHLASTADRQTLPDETAALLDFWLGNNDGGASARAAKEICDLLPG